MATKDNCKSKSNEEKRERKIDRKHMAIEQEEEEENARWGNKHDS